MRVIAVGEPRLGDRLGAADALGHVLAGHLEMHAARVRAFGAMHREEAPHLGQDRVDGTGLEAVRGLYRVAVHWIARPHDRPAGPRSEEHTSELQSLMRISYA